MSNIKPWQIEPTFKMVEDNRRGFNDPMLSGQAYILELTPIDNPVNSVDHAYNQARLLGSIPAFELFLKSWKLSIYEGEARYYIGILMDRIAQIARSGAPWYSWASNKGLSQDEVFDYEFSRLIGEHFDICKISSIDERIIIKGI